MAVPAGDERSAKSGHRLVFDDDVLQYLIERVAEVDVAVGVRRAVMEDILVLTDCFASFCRE